MLIHAALVLLWGLQAQPVPTVADQKVAEKKVRDLLSKDYASREQEGRKVLAQKLLETSATIGDDPALKFVMLQEAREIACVAMDLETAFHAIDRMAEAFDVKPDALRTSALAAARKAAVLPRDNFFLVDALLRLADERLRAEDFDAAGKLAREAEPAAKQIKAGSLAARASQIAADAPKLRKEKEKATAAQAKLVADPDDGSANLDAGRYLCFVKNDWPKGLALLAKASDKAIQQIAAAELDVKGEPYTLAKDWWAIGKKEKSGLDKDRYAARARFWGEKALAASGGVGRLQVEKLLDELDQATAVGPIVDLLALIDPRRDSVYGDWKKDGGVLSAPIFVPAQPHRLMIPYEPPDEYDLKIVMEPDAGAFSLGLPVPDGPQAFIGAGSANGPPFAAKVPSSVLVASVRRMSVVVQVDGKVVYERKGDFAALAPNASWAVSDAKALFLGSQGSCRFSKIVLISLGGSGKKIK